MPLYFTTVQLPADFDPMQQDPAVFTDMAALEAEMTAAGIVPKFAAGLAPASTTKSLRFQPGGEVLVTDGPYAEAKEYIGGISITEYASLDEAIHWATKGAKACRASGEVREIFFNPGE